MADLNIDLSTELQSINDAVTVMDSAIAFANGFEALAIARVTAALTADNSADQTSINAATQGIKDAAAAMRGKKDELAAALLANTPAAGTGGGTTEQPVDTTEQP